MTDMKPKFDIEKLNLHYGSFHALKDINMQISAHEITAFIGPRRRCSPVPYPDRLPEGSRSGSTMSLPGGTG